MSARDPQIFELLPLHGVVADGAGFVALDPEPWLELRPATALRGRAAIEICYSAGLADRVCRPLLQFRARDGRTWSRFLPAPSEGAGFWRGRVPPETHEIRICPTDRPGAFHFRIESLRTLTTRELMRLRMTLPRRGLIETGARLAQLREEADLNLRWVLERAETQNFETWRARRRRGQPVTRQISAHVTVVVASAFGLEDVERTCASLIAQSHADWRVVLIDGSREAAAWADAHPDPRISRRERNREGYSVFLRAGDRLEPNALSAFLAKFDRSPECDIVYSDDVRRAHADGKPEVSFKPDWSPIRQAFSPYVGRAAMLRDRIAQRFLVADGAAPQALVDAALAETPPGAVGHVARALVELADSAPMPPRQNRKTPPRAPKRSVTIIIPTRDKGKLLERCLASIFARTRDADYDVLVVDNGTTEPEALAVLERMQREEPRLTIAPNPMPFNFSALCNFGAARARGDTYVFLNNDTVVLQPQWLARMLEFAVRPDVGAVGCKLLFPDGRVQHSGIVLGMGGVAGHFGVGLGRRAHGWLGGSLAPHEVSAVTAACLMVERAKFEAVGRFDAENLPVDLNDVDLCLRLNARGWRTICDCRTMFAHHQSASRGGATLRLQRVYRKEREYFLSRWAAAVRNDPYFNPNLSLYDNEPKLA
ncbi:MAG: glycosyltransferase family 2 protein [Rhodoblastus sp.]|nr:glycosyltransferase family 2 protein [Rhodoblastus sp.]